jgi:transcriptional regulator with XRE-family HTH domain
MDSSTSTGKLLNTLKQQLRARGLHYRDVAAHLKVSEGTIKRYFSGKGVDIETLEKLAAIADLDLLSLARLAHEHSIEGGLNRAQQAALAKSQLTLAIIHGLGIGFSPAQLAAEFNVSEQMDAILARLESLGLIRRLGPNSVRVLTKPKFGGEVDGPIREYKVRNTREFLAQMDLHDEGCAWAFYAARLSPASAVRMRELIYRFASDVEALTKADIGLPKYETQWFRLFIGAQPISRQQLFRQK